MNEMNITIAKIECFTQNGHGWFDFDSLDCCCQQWWWWWWWSLDIETKQNIIGHDDDQKLENKNYDDQMLALLFQKKSISIRICE